MKEIVYIVVYKDGTMITLLQEPSKHQHQDLARAFSVHSSMTVEELSVCIQKNWQLQNLSISLAKSIEQVF